MDPATVSGRDGQMIHPFGGKIPQVHPSVFVAEGAEIIGDVEIGEDSSVWYNAVIRGDVNYIRIGARTNIQDGCLLHVRHELYPLLVGAGVTVGHGAILHACRVSDCCLIGMGAIVLDNAQIDSYSLVAAGAVVLNDTVVPGGSLVAGVPARVVRKLTPAECTMIETSAQNYIGYVKSYRTTKQ